MLALMPFRPAKRLARGGDAAVLGTYRLSTHTVQVLRTGEGRIEWTCDCEKFSRQSRCATPLWCKHIAKGAALRSLERLTARRVGSPDAGGAARGSNAALAGIGMPWDIHGQARSSRLQPSRIAPGDRVTPR